MITTRLLGDMRAPLLPPPAAPTTTATSTEAAPNAAATPPLPPRSTAAPTTDLRPSPPAPRTVESLATPPALVTDAELASAMRRFTALRERLRQTGLQILEPSGVEVLTLKEMTVRELVATLLELPPHAVTRGHLELLRAANPGLGALDAPVKKLTAITVHTTPAGALMLAEALRAEIRVLDNVKEEALAALPGEDVFLPERDMAELEARLRKARGALREALDTMTASRVLVLVAAAEEEARKLLLAGKPEEVEACYDEAKAKVARIDGRFAAIKATLALRIELSRIAAATAGAKEASGAGEPELASDLYQQAKLWTDALQRDPALTPAAREVLHEVRCNILIAEARLATLFAPSQLQQYLRDPTLRDGAFKAERREQARVLSERYLAAIASLEQRPANSARALEIRSLRSERRQKLAEIMGLIKDRAAEHDHRRAAFGCLLGLTGEETKQAFAPANNRPPAVGASSELALAISSAQKTGIGRLQNLLQSLPVAERTAALELLAQYTECLLATGGPRDDLRLALSLFSASCRDAKDPTLEARALVCEAKLASRDKDPRLAVNIYDKALATLEADTSAQGQKLAAAITIAKAMALAELAARGDQKTRLAVAAELRALLDRAETQESPLGRPERALLVMLTRGICFTAGELAAADELNQRLRTSYADLPEATADAEQFDQEHKSLKLAAFASTFLAEINGEPPSVTIIAGLAGAGAGAALGAEVFGVGALPGMMVGGAIGVMGAKAVCVTLSGGFGRMAEAYTTGLTRQGWRENLVNVGVLSADVVMAAAPITGMGALGKTGMRFVRGAALSEAEQLVVKGWVAKIERRVFELGGGDALRALEEHEARELARQMLLHEAATRTLRFGGAPLNAALLTTVASPFAIALVDIEQSALSEEEKAAARTELLGNFAQAALGMALAFGPTYLVTRAALGQTAVSAELRAALTADSPYQVRLALVSPEQLRAKAARLREEALAKDPRADVSRYDEIIENGRGLFDPVTHEVLGVDATAVTHELTHFKIRSLDPKLWQEVVTSVTSHERWPAIKKAYLEKYPEHVSYSDKELVGELCALYQEGMHPYVKGLRETLGEHAEAVYQIFHASRAMTRAGLNRVMTFDTAELVASGALTLPTRNLGVRKYQNPEGTIVPDAALFGRRPAFNAKVLARPGQSTIKAGSLILCRSSDNKTQLWRFIEQGTDGLAIVEGVNPAFPRSSLPLDSLWRAEPMAVGDTVFVFGEQGWQQGKLLALPTKAGETTARVRVAGEKLDVPKDELRNPVPFGTGEAVEIIENSQKLAAEMRAVSPGEHQYVYGPDGRIRAVPVAALLEHTRLRTGMPVMFRQKLEGGTQLGFIESVRYDESWSLVVNVSYTRDGKIMKVPAAQARVLRDRTGKFLYVDVDLQATSSVDAPARPVLKTARASAPSIPAIAAADPVAVARINVQNFEKGVSKLAARSRTFASGNAKIEAYAYIDKRTGEIYWETYDQSLRARGFTEDEVSRLRVTVTTTEGRRMLILDGADDLAPVALQSLARTEAAINAHAAHATPPSQNVAEGNVARWQGMYKWMMRSHQAKISYDRESQVMTSGLIAFVERTSGRVLWLNSRMDGNTAIPFDIDAAGVHPRDIAAIRLERRDTPAGTTYIIKTVSDDLPPASREALQKTVATLNQEGRRL